MSKTRTSFWKAEAAQEVTGKRDRSNSSVGSSQHGVAGKRDNTCNSSRDNRNKSLLLVRHEEDTLQSKKGLDCTTQQLTELRQPLQASRAQSWTQTAATGAAAPELQPRLRP